MNFDNNGYNVPWCKFYKDININFEIPDIGFYDYFCNKVNDFDFKNLCSLEYYGKKFSYKELLDEINICAKGLYDYGIRKGDIVTICLPNTIEGIVSFFAVNKLGAVANLMHPLSSENEIKDSLNETNSKVLFLYDANYEKFKTVENSVKLEKVILVNVYNYMPFVVNFIHKLTNKINLKSNFYVFWNSFFNLYKNKEFDIENCIIDIKANDDAVILHSGGTTGVPKGVVLSNGNLMSYLESENLLSPFIEKGDSLLAVLPMFHGFGLVSCILFALCRGMLVILKPRFDVNEYYNSIKKYKPQALAGVPTLYETVFDKIEKKPIKLDFLKYVIVGGDLLKPNLRNKVNRIIKENGSDVKIMVGYGLTEAISAIAIENCFADFKENTVGIPFPGFYIGIFSEDNKEVSCGEEGEICISGPIVMKGYYNNDVETKLVLKCHEDGRVWLHTGDLGIMDKDGYLTYLSRIKRMIISSGYNIYPGIIEEILEKHPSVLMCAVIGIPHKTKMEVPKAYIVLKDEFNREYEILEELKDLVKKNLSKYSWPVEYEFRKELPVTKLGKIDCESLKKEND